jgi:hypothetical protein
MEFNMKTWICCIYGGGAPTYLISAESEKRAWELIRKKVNGLGMFLTMDRCGGLVEVPDWHADGERIDDIHEMYARYGTIRQGTFKGF